METVLAMCSAPPSAISVKMKARVASAQLIIATPAIFFFFIDLMCNRTIQRHGQTDSEWMTNNNINGFLCVCAPSVIFNKEIRLGLFHRRRRGVGGWGENSFHVNSVTISVNWGENHIVQAPVGDGLGRVEGLVWVQRWRLTGRLNWAEPAPTGARVSH